MTVDVTVHFISFVDNSVYAFIWYGFYFVDSLTITDLYLQ